MLRGFIFVVFVLSNENIHGLDMVVNYVLQKIFNKMFMLGGLKILNKSNSQKEKSVYKHISGAHQILSHFFTRKNQLQCS